MPVGFHHFGRIGTLASIYRNVQQSRLRRWAANVAAAHRRTVYLFKLYQEQRVEIKRVNPAAAPLFRVVTEKDATFGVSGNLASELKVYLKRSTADPDQPYIFFADENGFWWRYVTEDLQASGLEALQDRITEFTAANQTARCPDEPYPVRGGDWLIVSNPFGYDGCYLKPPQGQTFADGTTRKPCLPFHSLFAVYLGNGWTVFDLSPGVQLHQSGSKRLPAGSSSVSVTFNPAFPSEMVPEVVATPNYATTIWVTDLTTSGCTIHVGTTSAYDQAIYWHAATVVL